MGEVYRADDLRLGRPVALKFLPASLKSDPESRARLLNEARAASILRSPNIAVTYDIGESDGADFIVMEFVDGELLSSRVAAGPLPLREAIEAGIQIADALDEAHARGIIHRDIKSANLMRTQRGLIKVLDFGLAKIAPGASALDVTRQQMTIAGMVLGTVSYMAPEQALGKPIDHRADLFSFGVVLFELLTGRVPFEGTTPTEIIDRILHEDPPPVSRFVSGTPAALDAIVTRALDKSPAFRYQSAREIYADLKALAADLDASPRRSSRITAVSVQRHRRGAASPVMTFSNITREPADDWIGTGIAETVSYGPEEHPQPVGHRPRAGVRRDAQSQQRHAAQRVARHRRRPPARRDLGRDRRLPAPRRDDPHHGQLRRRVDRRGAEDRQGRRPHRRHLRAAGQDRLRAEPGPQRRAPGLGGRGDRAAGDPVGRGLRELRARHDEPAPGDARVDGPRDRRLRGRDAPRPRLRQGVGRARRRVRAEGLVHEHSRDDPPGDRDRAARAGDRSGTVGGARLARVLAAQPRTRGRSDRRDPRGDPPRARQRPGAAGARAGPLGGQGGFRGARSPSSSARST